VQKSRRAFVACALLLMVLAKEVLCYTCAKLCMAFENSCPQLCIINILFPAPHPDRFFSFMHTGPFFKPQLPQMRPKLNYQSASS
jgi:hypothetical protein